MGRATTSRRIAACPASAWCTIAAMRRRSLLRVTAFPIDLLTVMPTSDDASPGRVSPRYTMTLSLEARRPCLRKRAKSAWRLRLAKRRITPRGDDGPSFGVGPALCAHSSCAFVLRNRARVCGDDYAVDTSASYVPLKQRVMPHTPTGRQPLIIAIVVPQAQAPAAGMHPKPAVTC